uniref:Uncharacterized protein n=1 Tax=Anguilla anguilla TaxID=7936 RepID=A0A0E9V4R2_ANGAN
MCSIRLGYCMFNVLYSLSAAPS